MGSLVIHSDAFLTALTWHCLLAQAGRHQSGSQEVPGSIPTGGNFFY